MVEILQGLLCPLEAGPDQPSNHYFVKKSNHPTVGIWSIHPTKRRSGPLRIYRVLLEGPSPVHSGHCGWCLPNKVFKKESLIYPLHLTQPYSASARCNVHNGYPPLKLRKFTTLVHSIYTFSVSGPSESTREESS